MGYRAVVCEWTESAEAKGNGVFGAPGMWRGLDQNHDLLLAVYTCYREDVSRDMNASRSADQGASA